MRFRQLFIIMIAAILFLFTACNQTPKQVPIVPIPDTVPAIAGNAEVRVLDIGKADVILVTAADKTVLIDVGESDDGGRIANVLDSLEREHIDLMVITHFDRDHVGGYMRIVERLPVGKIYYPNYRGTRDECVAFYDDLETSQRDAMAVTENISVTLGELYIEISPTKSIEYVTDAEHKRDNDNDMSLLISVWHGENRLLFAGDAEDARLREILNSNTNLRSTFLKVPHHGNLNGYSKNFLSAVHPVYAIICDSKKNPANETILSLLNSMKTEVMCTRDGDITLVSDGKTLTMTQGKI